MTREVTTKEYRAWKQWINAQWPIQEAEFIRMRDGITLERLRLIDKAAVDARGQFKRLATLKQINDCISL